MYDVVTQSFSLNSGISLFRSVEDVIGHQEIFVYYEDTGYSKSSVLKRSGWHFLEGYFGK